MANVGEICADDLDRVNEFLRALADPNSQVEMSAHLASCGLFDEDVNEDEQQIATTKIFEVLLAGCVIQAHPNGTISLWQEVEVDANAAVFSFTPIITKKYLGNELYALHSVLQYLNRAIVNGRPSRREDLLFIVREELGMSKDFCSAILWKVLTVLQDRQIVHLEGFNFKLR